MNTVNSDVLPLVKELREAADSTESGTVSALLRRAAEAVEAAGWFRWEVVLDTDGCFSQASRDFVDRFDALTSGRRA